MGTGDRIHGVSLFGDQCSECKDVSTILRDRRNLRQNLETAMEYIKRLERGIEWVDEQFSDFVQGEYGRCPPYRTVDEILRDSDSDD